MKYIIHDGLFGLFIYDERGVELSDPEAIDIAKRLIRKYDYGKRQAYLYMMYSRETGYYKIGYTTTSVNERLSGVRRVMKDDSIVIVDFVEFDSKYDAIEFESCIHKIYDDVAQGGEWFEFDVYMKLFMRFLRKALSKNPNGETSINVLFAHVMSLTTEHPETKDLMRQRILEGLKDPD